MRLLLLVAALLVPARGEAFYESYEGDQAYELTGNLRVNAGGGRLPPIGDVPESFYDRDLSLAGGILRLIGNFTFSGTVAVEAHVFQLVSGASTANLLGAGADGFSFSEAGRTAALTWRWYDRDGTRAELAVDRLNLRLDLFPVVLTIGRQPVNLATTYYFTPNDFFQSFSATTFFRVYKPGVDAARAEVQLGEFTQLTLVGVLGYDREPTEAPSVGDPPSFTASSFVGRFATSLFGFEWSLLGGKVPGYWVAGGGLQGELFEWLGVRAEGHYGVPQGEGRDPRVEVAFGLEHRFESSLYLRLEQFYHGSGADDPADYLAEPIDPNLLTGPLYLGRHYTALGASYELTSLLTVDGVFVFNWVDRSFLLSLYAVYSVLDEVEAALVVSLPVGEDAHLVDLGSQTLRLGSEFGTYPISALGELRMYF